MLSELLLVDLFSSLLDCLLDDGLDTQTLVGVLASEIEVEAADHSFRTFTVYKNVNQLRKKNCELTSLILQFLLVCSTFATSYLEEVVPHRAIFGLNYFIKVQLVHLDHGLDLVVAGG